MPNRELSVESLIQDLHSKDWSRRCDAARLLGQSRDPRAVDALLPDLQDADWRVRRNAAQALGALRDPRATEPLIRALADRVLTVRQRAVVALGRIKDPQALPALLKVLLEDQRNFPACLQMPFSRSSKTWPGGLASCLQTPKMQNKSESNVWWSCSNPRQACGAPLPH
jgi:HEAT repeat protein